MRTKHYSPLDGRSGDPDGTSSQAQLRVNEIPGRTRLPSGLHLERQGIFVILITWMLSVVRNDFLARWTRPAVVPASRWNWTNAVDCRTKTSAPKDTSAFPHSWTKPSQFTIHFPVSFYANQKIIVFAVTEFAAGSTAFQRSTGTSKINSPTMCRLRWRISASATATPREWRLLFKVRIATVVESKPRMKWWHLAIMERNNFRWMSADRTGNVRRRPGKPRGLHQLDGPSVDGSFDKGTRRHHLHPRYAPDTIRPSHFATHSPGRPQ